MRTEKFSIISFEDEKISFDKVLKHLGGLSDLEIDIFKHLLTIESPYGTCINRMVKTLKKDRSLIQRCLSKLIQIGIVIRERIRRSDYVKICEEQKINYKTGKNEKGSLYLYKPVSNSVLKQVLSNASKKWFEVIQTSIQDI